MGTGTSAHDICQELQANGADVTMVQRSPTLVVNVDPSAQLYDKTYLGDGPPVEVRDLLNASVPLEVVKASHKLITKEVRELRRAVVVAAGAGGLSARVRRRRHRLAAEIPHPRRRLLFQCRLLRADRRRKDPADPGGRHQAVRQRRIGARRWLDVEGGPRGAGDRLQGPGSHRRFAVRPRRGRRASGRSGGSMPTARNCATCGFAPGSPDCGSPAVRSRNAGSIRDSSRCRSMPSRKGAWKRRCGE